MAAWETITLQLFFSSTGSVILWLGFSGGGLQ